MALVVGGPGGVTLDGSSGNDVILGGTGDDIIDAGAGNDVIRAGNGNDVVLGGDGNDVIEGGAGNDIIDGGNGNDIINGGAGDDIMIGGAGSDIFRYTGDGVQNIGTDIITDFDPTQDKIDLLGMTGVTSLNDLHFTPLDDKTVVITSSKFVGSITVVGASEADLKANGAIAVACFLRGTRISTPEGLKSIEDLAIGDLVLTRDGGAAPVRWIGRRSYASRFLGRSPRILPVRIRAGALGDNLPARDLLVSPEHAMFFDGAFVDARLLINGSTIVQEKGPELIEYFHLDLGEHAVIFAEGAATESYVNHANRGMFQNAHEYAELYGEDDVAPALAGGHGHERVYPAVYGGARLQAVRDRVAEVAQADQRVAA